MAQETYTPAHVANFFLDKAHEEGRAIDPVKLQELVYIAYGWVLAVLDRRLFEEPVEAWRHGPVIPSLYHEFKHYRWQPIREYALEVDWEDHDFVEPRIPPDDHNLQVVLGKVWNVYKRFSGWALREKLHQAGTPWAAVHEENARHKQIPDNLIRDHFTRKINEYLDAAA